MPSTFPEAFGMVAVEAAACGTLPVSAGHSGMLEVSRELAAALPEEVGGADQLPGRAAGAVEAIATPFWIGWLAMPEAERGGGAGEHWSQRYGRLWSWEAVARAVLAASAAGSWPSLPEPK